MDKVQEDSEEHIYIHNWKEFLSKSKTKFKKKSKIHDDKKVKENDFKFLETIGSGSFGEVFMVIKNDDKKLYAVKLVKVSQRSINERDILKCLHFPFIIKLKYHYKDNINLSFVLEFVENGDLFKLLKKMGKFDERLAKFYSAQLLLALEYLHYNHIIYRDLKPENILLDKHGFIKLTDFGFSKQIDGRTYTLCGTPIYIAPEMLLSKGYGISSDYWAFGVLLYELNSGKSPFNGADNMELFENIANGKYFIKQYFSNGLRSLITSLLEVDTTRRSGNLKNGINDIKNHKWFAKILWNPLLNKTVTPPYVPGSNFHI